MRTCLLAVMALALPAAPLPAQQPDAAGAAPRLIVELNKVEPGEDGACRAFFLFRNRTDTAFEGFEMALAILDRDGVIDQLLTIDAAPLPADRTTLKLFEIPGIACDAISEVLMHDIPVCKPQNAAPLDCYGLIDLVSRAGADLVK